MLPNASSRELLKLIEGFGLSGSWMWTFDTGEQVWSSGLYRLLGLPFDTKPDFALLHRLIHPEDRCKLPSPSEVTGHGFSAERSLRLLRADNTLRTVESRTETYYSPAGRPLRAVGVLVDVSDREALLRAQAAQRRRNRTMFERVKAFTSTTVCYPFRDFSDEWVELVGIPKAELLDEPTLPVVKEERRRWRDHGHALYLAGKIVHALPHLVLAGGEVIHYRLLMVPVIGQDGGVECWQNYVAPLNITVNLPSDAGEALELRLEGCHLRAARALLDWSMGDLAQASGLSLSTVRRIEDNSCPYGARRLKDIVSSLRRHGIRFSLMEDSAIAVSRG